MVQEVYNHTHTHPDGKELTARVHVERVDDHFNVLIENTNIRGETKSNVICTEEIIPAKRLDYYMSLISEAATIAYFSTKMVGKGRKYPWIPVDETIKNLPLGEDSRIWTYAGHAKEEWENRRYNLLRDMDLGNIQEMANRFQGAPSGKS